MIVIASGVKNVDMSGSSDTIRSTHPIPCATTSRPRMRRYETVCLRIGCRMCWTSVRLVTRPWLTKNLAGGSLATMGSHLYGSGAVERLAAPPFVAAPPLPGRPDEGDRSPAAR